MSASSIATLAPSAASASARFTAVVDFLAFCRIAQLDIQRDVLPVDFDIPGATRRDEVLAGVGIDDLFQRGLYLKFRNAHCLLQERFPHT
jgi:hypothetical protein